MNTEHLVESAFTSEFDRQLVNIVRRRDDVDRTAAFAQPFEEDPERALGGPAVVLATHAAEALLDLVELQNARAEPFDCSLLMVDIAELRLDRGEPEEAHRVALSSFRHLQLLRDYPDAYRALIVLHTAAAESSLDRATIKVARSALVAASRS